jgi:ABC-2 type transport system ATP-binding protein
VVSEAPVLELDNVSKRYGGFLAVDTLSFRVAKGEIFGFLGPNGAGKTTTLRMALDIIRPTTGAIRVLGAKAAGDVRRRIGYLPEERGLYRKMRAADTIAYFAMLRGTPRDKARRAAAELLERFGLGEFARARNEQLSKGMAQKVQLLATVAHDPELLILDEPFSGLDPINQSVLEGLISELRAQGKTILFSTHTMQHAERLCDRFLIIAKGARRFEGTLAEARALFPPQIVARTDADVARLAALAGVSGVDAPPANGAERDVVLRLAAGAEPHAVLAAAVTQGLRVSRFETANASLHDIFVALAGDEAKDEAA